MTGIFSIFTFYVPCSGKDKVRITNGSFTPVNGKGVVRCSPSLMLSSVLHVPSFSVNLLSISFITKDLNYKVTFFPSHCILQRLATEEIIGAGKICNGLYLLDDTELSSKKTKLIAFTSSEDTIRETLLHHRRLGHPSHFAFSKLFPKLRFVL
ncbi:hypothetical protein AXF42_Ash007300 [Apostasia shenzhenica]|uniref:Uncharacterized protein n=1 Tax=Apostasia shenzhenica TaxID=1088818 RepID=A0A2I0B9S8_9ASPA|nr:hypothetical protein AXF42_Ash007300 [Apostasia shenzhenica]